MGYSTIFKLQALSRKPQSLPFSVFKVFLIEAEMKHGNTLIAVILSRSYSNPLT